MKRLRELAGIVTLLIITAGVGSELVRADEFSSTSYKINGVIGNSFGGGSGSTSYALESSGGESIIGTGTGGSYKLGEGYIAQLERSLQLTLDSSSIDFGTITPGSSTLRTNNVNVLTDASSYDILIHKDDDLKSGANTITASGIGTIATPLLWSEGTTKGLGFSVASSTPSLPASWSSGTKYAVIPASATSFFTRTGTTGGATDVYTINFRLDTDLSQISGIYSNVVTFTGVINP